MSRKVLTFLAILFIVLGPGSLIWGWYYFNQTELVPYVKSFVEAGTELDVTNNIVWKPTRLQDVPLGYMTSNQLNGKKWRTADNLYPTDPIVPEKLTDKIPLEINQNQIIVSFAFANSGILTFIQPGDHIAFIDQDKTMPRILVLGKFDKDANLISLLPSLIGSGKKEAQTMLDKYANANQLVPSTSALLLLVTTQEASDIAKMSDPVIALQSRAMLIDSKFPTEVVK